MNQTSNVGGDAFLLQKEPDIGPYPLGIVFTGSGSEYFRIWIVNMLLMLITFGIYYPWAKVRRLRYFFNNTLIGGQPLDFHGEPMKIFLGYLVMGILFSVYSAGMSGAPVLGMLCFLAVSGALPLILKSSMQFKLGNTSWRGLRLRFRGTTRQAYRAVLPVFIPGILLFVAALQVGELLHPPAWFLPVYGIVLLGTLAMLPWLYWKLKKFQHDNYAFASLQTTFTATPGSFYKLLFKFFGVFALICGIGGLVMGLPFIVTGNDAGSVSSLATAGAMALIMASLLTIPALLVFAKPYLITRFQNLVWNHTVNDALSFRSDLRLGSLLGLTIKNWLLIVLTLGFYWPFAAIAVARMRVQALSISLRDNPDALISEASAVETSAAGDAGADLFGLDIGL